LWRQALGAALLEQLRALNQTAAAVGTNRASTHQSQISPSQGFFEQLAITITTELGSSA
jgi:hypothetical protein